jgi:hypothetical protein
VGASLASECNAKLKAQTLTMKLYFPTSPSPPVAIEGATMTRRFIAMKHGMRTPNLQAAVSAVLILGSTYISTTTRPHRSRRLNTTTLKVEPFRPQYHRLFRQRKEIHSERLVPMICLLDCRLPAGESFYSMLCFG